MNSTLLHCQFEFRTYFSYRSLLINNEKSDIKKKELWQFDQLKREIDFAWNHIPFYKKLWSDAGFEPRKFCSLDDLKLIPIIDKNVVREHFEEFVNPDYPKDRLSLVTTGGTTGMPMKFYIDNYIARGKEMAFQVWGSKYYWDYRFGLSKVAIIRGFSIDEEYIKKGIYWQKTFRDNGLLFSSFHINEQTYSVYLKKLRHFRPKYIKAYPSSIVALCILMKRHKDFGIDGLKGVICSSENVYDSHRELVKEVLGVNIFSFYGHSEKSVSAFQRDDVMEFQPFYGFTEFLDENGNKVVEAGKKAQVIVTSLNNEYFPFIRYNTNDWIEIDDAAHKTAKRIIGRAQEFLVDRDHNRIVFTCADEIFWDIDGVIAYQYIQNEVGKLTLLLECDTCFTQESLQLINTAVKDMFYNFDIEVVQVNKIEKTAAGKFRYLIQNLQLNL